ncbi:hypothetical protein GCM10020220_045550 [Nonomuraea rubra]
MRVVAARLAGLQQVGVTEPFQGSLDVDRGGLGQRRGRLHGDVGHVQQAQQGQQVRRLAVELAGAAVQRVPARRQARPYGEVARLQLAQAAPLVGEPHRQRAYAPVGTVDQPRPGDPEGEGETVAEPHQVSGLVEVGRYPVRSDQLGSMAVASASERGCRRTWAQSSPAVRDSRLVTSTAVPRGAEMNGLTCARSAALSRTRSSRPLCSLLRHRAAASSSSSGMALSGVPRPRSRRLKISWVDGRGTFGVPPRRLT